MFFLLCPAEFLRLTYLLRVSEQFVSFPLLFIYIVHEDSIMAHIPKKYGVGDTIILRFNPPPPPAMHLLLKHNLTQRGTEIGISARPGVNLSITKRLCHKGGMIKCITVLCASHHWVDLEMTKTICCTILLRKLESQIYVIHPPPPPPRSLPPHNRLICQIKAPAHYAWRSIKNSEMLRLLSVVKFNVGRYTKVICKSPVFLLPTSCVSCQILSVYIQKSNKVLRMHIFVIHCLAPA